MSIYKSNSISFYIKLIIIYRSSITSLTLEYDICVEIAIFAKTRLPSGTPDNTLYSVIQLELSKVLIVTSPCITFLDPMFPSSLTTNITSSTLGIVTLRLDSM